MPAHLSAERGHSTTVLQLGRGQHPASHLHHVVADRQAELLDVLVVVEVRPPDQVVDLPFPVRGRPEIIFFVCCRSARSEDHHSERLYRSINDKNPSVCPRFPKKGRNCRPFSREEKIRPQHKQKSFKCCTAASETFKIPLFPLFRYTRLGINIRLKKKIHGKNTKTVLI